MRTALLLSLSLLPTVVLADVQTGAPGEEICTSSLTGTMPAESVVRECTKFVASPKLEEAKDRVRAYNTRAEAYRRLGKSDFELRDRTYVIANSQGEFNLIDRTEALDARARIYLSNGEAEKAALDLAEAKRINPRPYQRGIDEAKQSIAQGDYYLALGRLKETKKRKALFSYTKNVVDYELDDLIYQAAHDGATRPRR